MTEPILALTDEQDALVKAVRAQVGERLAAADAPPGPARDALARELIADALEAHARERLSAGHTVLDAAGEAVVARAAFDALFGLGGFQQLLDDPLVENILVNGFDRVFVVRDGQPKTRCAPVAASDGDLVDLVRQAAARSGAQERRFDRGSPILDLQLPDGSRLHAVMDVAHRPSVSIRRHRYTKVSLADLVGLGVIDQDLAKVLGACVRAGLSTVIGGGPGVGKTTMLRALAAEIDPAERLVTIEDTYELALHENPEQHPDVVALQRREANLEGVGEVSLADLLRAALRMSPQRVIVGEARGAEIVGLLDAMSIGLDGSLATVHTSGSKDAFTRMATLVMRSPEHPTMEGANLMIAGAVDLVLHLDTTRERPSRRVLSSIREVVGADGQMITSNEVYKPGPDKRAVPGAPWRAQTADRLLDAGLDPDVLERASTGWGWNR